MTEETIIYITVGVIAAALAIAGLFLGANYIIRPKILLKRRMKQIGVIGDGAQTEKTDGRRQKRIQDKIKQLEKKNGKQSFTDAIRSDILQAGLDISIEAYFILGAVIAVLGAFFYLMAGFQPWGAAAVALIGFVLVPKMTLKYIARRRRILFTKHFADAIDLVVRGIKSGLPVNECFSVVAREFAPPMGEEFRLIVEGQNLGITLDDLMERALKRLPTAEYRFFAIVTQIQRQTGGNLADTLSNLSAVLRERKKLRDKIKALSSEAKASATIIGSLPFFVMAALSLINPDYLMLLFTETAGNYMLAGGGAWMGLGIFVMKNMIEFKI